MVTVLQWFNESRQLVRQASSMRSPNADISLKSWQDVHDQLNELKLKYASSSISKKATKAIRLSTTKYRELTFGKCHSSTQLPLTHAQLYLQDAFSESLSRAMLLFHDVGSGKTCAALSIAEELRARRPLTRVMVVCPAALKDTFRRQIYNPTSLGINGVISGRHCVLNRYASEAKRVASAVQRESDVEFMRTLVSSYISQAYKIKSHGEFVNIVRSYRSSTLALENAFDNTLLIVDEFHRASTTAGSGLREISNSLAAVAKIPSVRILLMSATPMFDKPEECIWFFNLLATSGNLPGIQTSDIFTSDPSKNIGHLSSISIRPDVIRDISRRCVSRVKSDTRDFARIEPPLPFSAAHLHTSTMSETQSHIVHGIMCSSASKTVNSDEPNSFSIAASTSANIVFPAGPDFLSNFEIVTTRRRNQTSAQKSYKYRANVIPFLSPINISTYSCKIAEIVRILSDPKSKNVSFVYSQYIHHGVVPLAMALESAGWQRYGAPNLLQNSGSGSVAKRYVLFAGDEEISQRDQWGNILEYMNQPANVDGSLVCAVLGTQVISEGISLMNVRQVHILEPWFNMQRMRQVIGRAVRRESHIALPPKDRVVRAYIHIAVENGSQTQKKKKNVKSTITQCLAKFPDEIRFDISVQKQRLISEIEEIMEENSIEIENSKQEENNLPPIESTLLDMDRVYPEVSDALTRAANRLVITPENEDINTSGAYRVVSLEELVDAVKNETGCDGYDDTLIEYVAQRMYVSSSGHQSIRYVCPYYVIVPTRYAALVASNAQVRVPRSVVPLRISQILSTNNNTESSDLLQEIDKYINTITEQLSIESDGPLIKYVVDMWIDHRDSSTLRELIALSIGSAVNGKDARILSSLVSGGYIQLDSKNGDNVIVYDDTRGTFSPIKQPPQALILRLQNNFEVDQSIIDQMIEVARGMNTSKVDIGFISKSDSKNVSNIFRVVNNRTRRTGFVCIDQNKTRSEFVKYIKDQTNIHVHDKVRKKDFCIIFELALRTTGRFIRPPIFNIFTKRQQKFEQP